MNLERYFKKYRKKGLNKLADRIGYDADYLWQCASRSPKTGEFRRLPGNKLCVALISADSRFTMASLRPDIHGSLPPTKSRRRCTRDATATA